MKSSTRDLILKIVGYLLFIMVILIFVKYIMVLNKNKNNNYSSQTVNTVEKNNKIIHTHINNSQLTKSIEEEKDKLMLEITQKLEAKLKEKFTSDSVCIKDPTNSIYYLYLQVQLLEGIKFKPEPIWTNQVFCLYKVKPVLSLDASATVLNTVVTDYYVPLGDIVLFKN